MLSLRWTIWLGLGFVTLSQPHPIDGPIDRLTKLLDDLIADAETDIDDRHARELKTDRFQAALVALYVPVRIAEWADKEKHGTEGTEEVFHR